MRACTMRTRRIASNQHAKGAAADPTTLPRNPRPHALIVLNLQGKTLLITGATGSFGTAFVRRVLSEHDVRVVRAFSRDELKQSELAKRFPDPRLRLLIGDVRDRDRLRLATRGVDVIVHAAALKQVPVCEYNPFEAVQTNVVGAQNVVAAAIDNDVPLTISLSTDKAVNPVNLYGATKLCAEKIVAQANTYAAGTRVRFGSVRYGNVVGSRGSVIPIFKQQALDGVITITDERMTRFWITIDDAVEFVLSCMPLVQGGETFVPKIPSMRIVDMASALAPDAQRRIIGIRAGEKLHEVLVTEDEARHCYDLGDRFVIFPELAAWDVARPRDGERLPDGFRFASDLNDRWLSAEDLRRIAASISPSSSGAGDEVVSEPSSAGRTLLP
jgi:UDP-N-acetylglucosamine 4,6-dehydratase/5-epimerase